MKAGTKISAITDDKGVPICLALFPGNASDQRVIPPTFGDSHTEYPLDFYADRGYDSARNREFVQSRGYTSCIYHKKQRPEKRSNKIRIEVEHAFSWLKQYRRLTLRYEKCVIPPEPERATDSCVAAITSTAVCMIEQAEGNDPPDNTQ